MAGYCSKCGNTLCLCDLKRSMSCEELIESKRLVDEAEHFEITQDFIDENANLRAKIEQQDLRILELEKELEIYTKGGC